MCSSDLFREMYQKTESWIHTNKVFDPTKEEERMDNAVAEQIYELERCVECGCCIAACGTARMRDDFLGAASLNRVARFVIDPRDQRTDKEYFEIIGNDYGIFGCMGLLACEDGRTARGSDLTVVRASGGWTPPDLHKRPPSAATTDRKSVV